MDKYEYRLKLDEMKSLAAGGHYKAAAEIADGINWHKIKNANALMKAGEIYEKAERYGESRDVLLMAYDHSPLGRMIIYRLAKVAIKMGNYAEAKDYYQEFVEIAHQDNLRYVLEYEICKAEGGDLQAQISILETLKEQEYSEEWAYELACLYHEAGMSEKCIEACDELILWFGDGPYVEGALELKMLYQPLTRQQEEKYRQFRLNRDSASRMQTEDEQEPGEVPAETIRIPEIQVSQERFNTQNLQEELQRSMEQIRYATEKEAIDDGMDTIKRLVEEIPYLQLAKSDASSEAEAKFPHIATDKEIDNSLKNDFQEYLAEDYDGQMRMFVSGGGVVERQVTGQMCIDEVLAEWDKTRRAAEAALQEAEQRKLESAKARALQEAGEIMGRLADVIPKLDSGLTPRDLLAEEYLSGQPIAEDRAVRMVTNMNQILQQQIDRLSHENAQIDEQLAAAARFVPEEAAALGDKGDMHEIFAEADESFELRPEEAAYAAEALRAGFAVEEELLAEPSMEMQGEEPADTGEEHAEEADTGEEHTEEEYDEETDAGEEYTGEADAAEAQEEDGLAEPGLPVVEIVTEESFADEDLDEELPEEQAAAAETSVVDIEEALLAETARELRQGRAEHRTEKPSEENAHPEKEPSDGGARALRQLSEEQREIFTYFVPVKGMEQQLCRAMTGVLRRLASGGSAATGNLMIQGGQGSGKTVLATSVVRALQKELGRPMEPVGKIEATSLNQKDIPRLLKKIAGGCLIIERVGGISQNTAETLAGCLAKNTSGILIIIEDTHRGLEKALGRDAGFAACFSEKIYIPAFTIDELVVFAKAYARELGYTIDEMGTLALYNSLSNIQKLDQATTLSEVREIMDDAIVRAERGGLKKAFSILSSHRYDDDDYVILREKDFVF